MGYGSVRANAIVKIKNDGNNLMRWSNVFRELSANAKALQQLAFVAESIILMCAAFQANPLVGGEGAACPYSTN